MSAWYTYIVRCSDGSLYVGISNDVVRRVKRHNDGSGAYYTKMRRLVSLVWSEKAISEPDARKRELQIKGWTRIKKENLVRYGHPYGSSVVKAK